AAMTAGEDAMEEFPLFAKLSPALAETGQVMNGPVIGYAKSYDTAAVNSMLNTPQVRMMLPRDVKLMWGVKPIDPAETTYELYAIKANTRDGKAPLDGAAVADARGDFAEQGSAAEVYTRDGKAPLDGAAVADARGDFAEPGSAAEVQI